MNKKIIAVFGGSFNPPINSHLSLAKQIIEKSKCIEKLIFVPVSTKYQKEKLVEDKHRYNMLKLMCEAEKYLEISDIELKQSKQLYTIQTLELLKKQYGEEYEIWFVMGTDNLKEIETWKEPKRLLEDYKIVVLKRNNDNTKQIVDNISMLKEHSDSIIEIEGIEQIDLSSSMIREKIRKGEDVEEYVPKKVLKYIKK